MILPWVPRPCGGPFRPGERGLLAGELLAGRIKAGDVVQVDVKKEPDLHSQGREGCPRRRPKYKSQGVFAGEEEDISQT